MLLRALLSSQDAPRLFSFASVALVIEEHAAAAVAAAGVGCERRTDGRARFLTDWTRISTNIRAMGRDQLTTFLAPVLGWLAGLLAPQSSVRQRRLWRRGYNEIWTPHLRINKITRALDYLWRSARKGWQASLLPPPPWHMTHSESHLSTPFEFHQKKEENCQACAGALLEMHKMGKLWVDLFMFCGVVFCNFFPAVFCLVNLR